MRRWALGIFLVLMIAVGVWSTFVRPFVNRTAEDAAGPAVLDVTAASGAAERYALDYLSWSPGSSNAARGRALAAMTVGGGEGAGTGGPSWSGSGYLSASAAVTEGVRQLPGESGVVTVDVRVVVASPGKGVRPLSPPAAGAPSSTPAAAGNAAEAAAVPEGYQVRASVWIRLAVPVLRVGPDVRIAASGPVFVGERSPVASTAGAEGTVDAVSTSDTERWARDFMTAYASGDTEYQTAAGATLSGLSGVVKVEDLAPWALTAARADGTRVGTASVTWRLAAADLTIGQTYTLGVTKDADRWYASTVGPVSPVGEQGTADETR